jgi:hypothetical protein
VLRSLLIGVLLVMAGRASANERIDDVSSYIFGNSLIHHLSPSDETTVPHWLHHLAVAAGKRYAVDGQWGFPQDFLKSLPPTDQWAFKQVPQVWNKASGPFEKAAFNTIITNPSNFVQDSPPDVVFKHFGPQDKTPVDMTVELFDWVEKSKPGLRYFIYEGWSIMKPFSRRFPPDAGSIAAFHAHNRGKYHDWYVKALEQIKAKRPGLDVRLIPVASVLAKMLTETPLRDIKPTELYSDLDPHGTNNIYFLAAVVTYTALYEAKAPENFAVPASLHPLVKAHYRQIADMACTETLGAGACGASASNH